MEDQWGRTIDYLRISVTDRCNLRCRYCMDDAFIPMEHSEVLRYEEVLRLAEIFVSLGICHFRVTGGEPLVRRGVTDFLTGLRALPGVKTVTLTTNGVTLADHAEALAEAGIDGVNVSLDAADPLLYEAVTGGGRLSRVEAGIFRCLELGIPVKLNCVLLQETASQILPLAGYAACYPLDVRFIERMPIGAGRKEGGLSQEEAREILQRRYPDLHPVRESRGFGPAWYEASEKLQGRIGWIDAVSHGFCAHCNRVRLTSDGLLKPCLCYGEGSDLRGMLRSGASDEILREQIRQTILEKPERHCFSRQEQMTEERMMCRIGG